MHPAFPSRTDGSIEAIAKKCKQLIITSFRETQTPPVILSKPEQREGAAEGSPESLLRLCTVREFPRTDPSFRFPSRILAGEGAASVSPCLRGEISLCFCRSLWPAACNLCPRGEA